MEPNIPPGGNAANSMTPMQDIDGHYLSYLEVSDQAVGEGDSRGLTGTPRAIRPHSTRDGPEYQPHTSTAPEPARSGPGRSGLTAARRMRDGHDIGFVGHQEGRGLQ